MGNSEVGHNALGAGRVFDQGAKLVGQAIADGHASSQGEVWQALVERVRGSGRALHFIGLLSDGNVHSHIDHLFALLRRCDRGGRASACACTCCSTAATCRRPARSTTSTRSRSCSRRSARKPGRDYRIASGGGRMTITMDRYEADWAMVERGWQTHVHGEARGFASARARRSRRCRGETPGHRRPEAAALRRSSTSDGEPVGPIRDGDAVVLLQLPRRPRDRDQPGLRGRRRSRTSIAGRAPTCSTPA